LKVGLEWLGTAACQADDALFFSHRQVASQGERKGPHTFFDSLNVQI